MGVVEPVNKHSPCSQRGARREGNASNHGTWTISCTTPLSREEPRGLAGMLLVPLFRSRRFHV